MTWSEEDIGEHRFIDRLFDNRVGIYRGCANGISATSDASWQGTVLLTCRTLGSSLPPYDALQPEKGGTACSSSV